MSVQARPPQSAPEFESVEDAKDYFGEGATLHRTAKGAWTGTIKPAALGKAQPDNSKDQVAAFGQQVKTLDENLKGLDRTHLFDPVRELA
jgi:hypothetical protein